MYTQIYKKYACLHACFLSYYYYFYYKIIIIIIIMNGPIDKQTHSFQIIDKPTKNIKQILPFKLRKCLFTQPSAQKRKQQYSVDYYRNKNKPKLNYNYNSNHDPNIDNQISSISNILNTKFIAYQLTNIPTKTKQQITKILNSNLTLHKTKQTQPQLLNQLILTKINEPIKALHYTSARYQMLFEKLKEIFQQFMTVGLVKKYILIAYGQVSKDYYIFFQNCSEQPYSVCCGELVYVKVCVNQYNTGTSMDVKFSMFRKNNRYNQQFQQIKSLKTQIYCLKCSFKIIQFYGYGQGSIQSSFSPKKIQNLLQIQNQRKKIKLAVMVDSGKFKKLHIDSPSKYQAILSQRFNPLSLFSDQRINQSLKLKTQRYVLQKVKPVKFKNFKIDLSSQLSFQ